MKPGKLYQTKLDVGFCYIVNKELDLGNARYYNFGSIMSREENPFLMYVEPQSLTLETFDLHSMVAFFAFFGNYARQEFSSTGKIRGGIFLVGNKTIWISHFGMAKLTEAYEL